MIRLRADEHRYLLSATGLEEALVRRIPGCRYVASAQAFQLPRQPGVVLSLDRLFGPDGWEHPADLGQEIQETRGRAALAAQQRAVVSLIGTELSVECAFGDKELVKLVPGYRWSAPQRRWFLPASPMALELMREYFGDLLEVEAAAGEFIELRARDEAGAMARAGRSVVAEAAGEAEPAVVEVVPERASIDDGPPEADEPANTDAAPGEALLARLDRLTSAVEDLVSVLRDAGGFTLPAPEPGVAEEVPADELRLPSSVNWRELMGTLDSNAGDVLEQANRLLQTASSENEASLRAVAGLALARVGQHPEALGALRRALERPGALDEDLAREAARSYTSSVLALVTTECGPEAPVGTEADFRDRIRDELVNDSGFDDERLGSAEARTRLDYLVNDPVLRRLAPELSDYCRIAHLLGVARGGQWMAATRVTDILQEHTLGNEGFAFALMLLANALYGGAAIDEWDKAWPREDVQETLQDLAWLVTNAEVRLKAGSLDASMAEPAALACLACIAGGPVEWASTSQRKSLVQLISLRHASRREYAEFLAAFQPAASGQKGVLSLFPGWTKVLAQTRLSRSAPYLMDVAANDHGGSGSLTWALGESVYLQALGLWGIDDAQAELIDLLDLLEGGKRRSSLTNEVAGMVEDEAFAGSNAIPRDVRKRLYLRVLQTATKDGYDRDAVAAFDRYVRELRDEGEDTSDAIRALCEGLKNGMKALRAPALTTLLNLQLENGEPFEETADSFARQFRPGDEPWEEFAGLGIAFENFRSHIEEVIPDLGLGDVAIEQTFAGRRVLIAGGHPSLRKHALPVLERWGIEATWLGPEQLKGDRALDAARGSAELVIINTACIGHAGSGRIKTAAEGAKKEVRFNHGRGAGSVIMSVWNGLSDEGEQRLEEEKKNRVRDRRKLLR